MCAKDIFDAVGTTIFNGLWGDAKLLYLSVLLALNLVLYFVRVKKAARSEEDSRHGIS